MQDNGAEVHDNTEKYRTILTVHGVQVMEWVAMINRCTSMTAAMNGLHFD